MIFSIALIVAVFAGLWVLFGKSLKSRFKEKNPFPDYNSLYTDVYIVYSDDDANAARLATQLDSYLSSKGIVTILIEKNQYEFSSQPSVESYCFSGDAKSKVEIRVSKSS